MNNTILILDVYYPEGTGKGYAAAILYPDFTDDIPLGKWKVEIEEVEEYIPGNFFRRELPCLLKVIEAIPEHVMKTVKYVITDSYTHFSADRPGLGWKLWEALEKKIPVIGIAKNKFKGATTDIEVYRGEDAKKPLYVSSIGFPTPYAAEYVKGMVGRYRKPEAVRAVDFLSRH